jgi:hypothetical protein
MRSLCPNCLHGDKASRSAKFLKGRRRLDPCHSHRQFCQTCLTLHSLVTIRPKVSAQRRFRVRLSWACAGPWVVKFRGVGIPTKRYPDVRAGPWLIARRCGLLPASPYVNMNGAHEAIQGARVETGRPFPRTLGGFQHSLIEFARHVAGLRGCRSRGMQCTRPDKLRWSRRLDWPAWWRELGTIAQYAPGKPHAQNVLWLAERRPKDYHGRYGLRLQE